ncbi:hypothetical protein ON010_g15021 [Phytophthora cinnamomi]|nr:hypothetical protein ON010_g15021 [Phytophthora cinnamomi]
MGIAMSKVFAALFGSKEVRILILGLDNAGKTTILCRRDRADGAHDRLQHGDAAVQEHQVPGLGPGRPDEHPALLAVLLPQHGRHHLRRGLGRRRPSQHRQAGAARHARGGRAEGLDPARVCQQAGPEGGAERCSGAAREGLLGISEAMGLSDIRNRQWSIKETTATQGAGLFEGFDCSYEVQTVAWPVVSYRRRAIRNTLWGEARTRSEWNEWLAQTERLAPAGTNRDPAMNSGAGDAVWYGPPESWPTEHCRVLYAISRYARQARSVQWKETWIRQVALLVLLYEGIDAGILPFDYSPSLIWLTYKKHTDRRWLRVSQEAKSVIDDLWEAKLVNGVKLSSVDYQPVTAYQVSFRGLSIVEEMPEQLKRETNEFLYAPVSTSRTDAGTDVHKPPQLLYVRYDGSDFHLVTRDKSYTRVSTITECEDVSYVSSPYIPSCLRSSTSHLVEPTNNKLRATESAHGFNMMTKEAKQSIILSQVHALVGEWLPFGANQISALNERLGAMERCQGGLFSSKLDLQPTETHFEVTPGLTQVKILDFDAIRFINFEAEINFPESDGIIQVENFGMHLHVSGAVLYGVKIDAIMNYTERSIPLDLLARLLVDVHQDSSGIIKDLLSRYQHSVLDMLFMGKADQRNKYNLITAAGIEPKLPACKYLDKGERENELKQVLGEIYACYDITRDDVLFLGRDGCLLSGPGAERYESLLTTFMGLNSREIFIRNFFVRTFVLNDMLTSLRKSIRSYRKVNEHTLESIKKSLSDAARHMILLIECLEYLLESVEALELPPVPVDIAGSKIYKCLQLLERKSSVIVRCKDSIKLMERLRTQLDTLITKFEGISRLQLTYVSQGFDINIRRLTESLRVRDELERNLEIIRVIFAGNLLDQETDNRRATCFSGDQPCVVCHYLDDTASVARPPRIRAWCNARDSSPHR